MAETIVNFAIEQLLQFANTEAGLIRSIPGEITFIRSELETIRVVLKDAEIKAEDDKDIKVWVKQVREVAYKIKDAIDDYLFLQRKRKDQPLVKVIHFFTQLRPKHVLADTIKMIKDEIIQINSRRQRYEFRTTPEGTRQNEHPVLQTHDNSSLYLDDTELVGIEEHSTEVIRLLEQSPLVALVGMGGLGKSTLARKVYNQLNKVRERFSICAWVTVSQSYSDVDLLKSVYKQFCEPAKKKLDDMKNLESELDGMQDLESITKALRNYLHDTRNRFLVVLDDVWVEGSLMNSIRNALPASNDGSRILMTMRDEDIATFWTTKFKGDMYHLKPLPANEAFDLFCKQIFGNGKCPEQLTSLAEEITRKCAGLPLVLVAVGGLLSTKRVDCSEWSKISESLGSDFATNSHLKSSTEILLLSYWELPYYLKPCFLYCGIFPEDYSINCKRLVRLWIAEGFIKSRRRKTLEEVAFEYLTSLVKRNLVHVSEKDLTTGYPKTIRVHDVLREIILSKLEESGFSQVITKDDILENTHFRRLSIHKNFHESIQMCTTTCNIRSVLVFDSDREVSSSSTTFQSKVFRFLRVLDLEGTKVEVIPIEVGDLHNLHLLSLRYTWVRKLPKSIGKLWNLQTLDLKGSFVYKLPKEAKYLHKLRHLIGYSMRRFPKQFPFRILEIPMKVLINFRELQTLEYIDGKSDQIMELTSLKQLTRLEIGNITTESWADLVSAIEDLEHLRSLTIGFTTPPQFTKTCAPRYLECLSLEGTGYFEIEKLPEWIPMLTNLTKLKLRGTRLREDPAEKLQGLANLMELQLHYAYDGLKLDFGVDGFQKLKVLILSCLESLRVIEGALPALRCLRFYYTTEKEIPVMPPHILPYVEYA